MLYMVVLYEAHVFTVQLQHTPLSLRLMCKHQCTIVIFISAQYTYTETKAVSWVGGVELSI